MKTIKKPRKQQVTCSMCEAEFIIHGHSWYNVEAWQSGYRIKCPYCGRWILFAGVNNGDK